MLIRFMPSKPQYNIYRRIRPNSGNLAPMSVLQTQFVERDNKTMDNSRWNIDFIIKRTALFFLQ